MCLTIGHPVGLPLPKSVKVQVGGIIKDHLLNEEDISGSSVFIHTQLQAPATL